MGTTVLYPFGDKSIRARKTKGSLPVGVPISDNQQIMDTDMEQAHMANINRRSKSDVVGLTRMQNKTTLPNCRTPRRHFLA